MDNKLMHGIVMAEAEWNRLTSVPGSAAKDYMAWRKAKQRAEADAIAVLRLSGFTLKSSGAEHSVKFAGVRSTSTCGLVGALSNWSVAARKKLAAMEADHG